MVNKGQDGAGAISNWGEAGSG